MSKSILQIIYNLSMTDLASVPTSQYACTQLTARSYGMNMEPFKNPVDSTTFAAEQIRAAIVSGRFKPGEHLREQQLTEGLNLSRHPVREALRLLEREGFVEIRRNRGAVVKPIDRDSVLEVYSIRAALGSIALRQLPRLDGDVTMSLLNHLEELAGRALQHAKAGDHPQYAVVDLEFQQSIVDATGLQRTMRYFSELTADVRRFNNMTGIEYRNQIGEVSDYLLPLLQAIKGGNFDEAERIWHAKFDLAVDRYLEILPAP